MTVRHSGPADSRTFAAQGYVRAEKGSGSKFALAAWLGILSLSFFLYTSDHPFIVGETRGDIFHLQIAALCTFFALASLRIRPWMLPAPALSFFLMNRVNPHTLLSLFFLYVAVLSFHARAPSTSFGYAVLTWSALLMSAISWPTKGGERRSLYLAAWAMTIVLAGLLLVFGGPKGRLIGGNQPNALGQAAVVAITCGILARGAMRILIIGFGLAFIYLVDSRSAGLAIVVFFLILILCPPYGRILPSLALRSVAMLGVGICVCVLMMATRYSVFSSPLGDWLRLTDPQSGLGSGMTGRTALMSIAIGSVLNHPFIGAGFRMEFLEGGHSGYLSLLGETGIIGCLLLLPAIGWTLMFEWQKARNSRLAEDDRLISKVIVAFLGANLLVLWPIEPLYISLGFPTQALLLYFLGRPLYGIRLCAHGSSIVSERGEQLEANQCASVVRTR